MVTWECPCCGATWEAPLEPAPTECPNPECVDCDKVPHLHDDEPKPNKPPM